ncbi:all-trans-retinol dehydrogenase (NAD+) [Microdochium nivale]|nr:all-trans-retinol dehydrogenase (NAD+) [Microdochium nivale]
MTIPSLIAGALLAATAHYPQQAQALLDKLPAALITLLRSPGGSMSMIKLILRVILALDVLRTANRVLNRMATNHWRFIAQPGWHWPDEIAVVTGGCSGIGQQLAYGLLTKGATVIVLDIQDLPDEMQATARSLCPPVGKTKQKLFYYKCDITSPESVSSVVSAIAAEPGIPGSGPSILINNAGVSHELPILTVPLPQVQRMFQVNTIAHWTLVQAFLPGMIAANKGHVVTVASLASFVALPYGGAYAATKAAALAFHEALACEIKHVHASSGVVCSVVHPNFVDTPLTKGFADKLERGGLPPMLTSRQVSDAVLEQVVQKRRGGQVFVPATAWSLSMLRAGPNWVQEIVRDVVGRGAAKQFGRVTAKDLKGPEVMRDMRI